MSTYQNGILTVSDSLQFILAPNTNEFTIHADGVGADRPPDSIVVANTGDSIEAILDKHLSVFDLGKDLLVTVQGSTDTRIYGAAQDPGLTIDFARDATLPTLSSDHHGGTLLTLKVGGVVSSTVDLVGDRSFSLSHVTTS